MIIERYKVIYAINHVPLEFIATSRLTEYVRLLFKAMNVIGEDQELKDRQARLFCYLVT
ncbi:hypothetical protein BN1088_1220004 [Sphingobacterium sp. PM2-P1-29]|nr:hypothetical protein BN1088_1220004 [Sphingobacterium sp. PM2-P1-29]